MSKTDVSWKLVLARLNSEKCQNDEMMPTSPLLKKILIFGFSLYEKNALLHLWYFPALSLVAHNHHLWGDFWVNYERKRRQMELPALCAHSHHPPLALLTWLQPHLGSLWRREYISFFFFFLGGGGGVGVPLHPLEKAVSHYKVLLTTF